jgi:hypothetical protein
MYGPLQVKLVGQQTGGICSSPVKFHLIACDHMLAGCKTGCRAAPDGVHACNCLLRAEPINPMVIHAAQILIYACNAQICMHFGDVSATQMPLSCHTRA